MDKVEEAQAQMQVDEKSKKTAIGLYERKLQSVKEARDCSADTFWLSGFKKRTRRRDDAHKQLAQFLEGKPYDLQVTADLAEFNKQVKALKDAIADVDEHTRDQKGAVEELQQFLLQYEDAALFFTDMPTTADFDLKTGAVKLIKINR